MDRSWEALGGCAVATFPIRPWSFLGFLAMDKITGPLASERVLNVPELLDMIFSFLDDHSNIINACVSKRWSSIALDKVWRRVEDVSRLLSLLAPLEPMSPGAYASSKPRFVCTPRP